MTTAKAQYRGDATGSLMRDFSEGLKTELRLFYPNHEANTCDVWGYPADMFVEHILGVARWAIEEMNSHKVDITGQEIRAEHADLLKTLTTARDKLRNLSPDFERLLTIDADALGCADEIQMMIARLEAAKPQIDSLKTMRKYTEKMHDVAMEMSVLVLRELAQYKGISIGATASEDYGTSSDGLKILKLIGDDIDLKFGLTTWRNIVAEAKQSAQIKFV